MKENFSTPQCWVASVKSASVSRAFCSASARWTSQATAQIAAFSPDSLVFAELLQTWIYTDIMSYNSLSLVDAIQRQTQPTFVQACALPQKQRDANTVSVRG